MARPKPKSCVYPFGSQGYTLMDLLIAVAIVGILAAIALPSYQSYAHRAARADAKGLLLQNAQFLERNYTVNNCYHRTDADCANTAITGTGAVVLPYLQSPATGTANYNMAVSYSITSPCTLGNCFSLSAAPTGMMASDACGTYTLTNTGIQGNTGLTSGETATDCWQR